MLPEKNNNAIYFFPDFIYFFFALSYFPDKDQQHMLNKI